MQSCLLQANPTAVLVGFTQPEQIAQNLTVVGYPLTDDEFSFVRDTPGRLQQALDARREVFLNEKGAGR